MAIKKVTVKELRQKYSKTVKVGVKKGLNQVQIIDGLVKSSCLTIKDDRDVKALLTALIPLRTVNRLKSKK
jgi:uncharacterized protein YnzC (UPF0291/DUF896 family)